MQSVQDFFKQRTKDRKMFFENPDFYKWSERSSNQYTNEYGTKQELLFLIQYITGKELKHYRSYKDAFDVLENIAKEQLKNKDPHIDWGSIYKYIDKRLRATGCFIEELYPTENIAIIHQVLGPYRKRLTKK